MKCFTLYRYVFVVLKDRHKDSQHVVLVNEGEHVIPEPLKEHGVKLSRKGSEVYVHLPNQVFVLQPGSTLNLTYYILEVRDVDASLPEKVLRLESELFSDDLSEEERRFLRYYIAYTILSQLDSVNDTLRDTLLLTVSRVLNTSVEDILHNREKYLKNVKKELERTLEKMKGKDVSKLFFRLFS